VCEFGHVCACVCVCVCVCAGDGGLGGGNKYLTANNTVTRMLSEGHVTFNSRAYTWLRQHASTSIGWHAGHVLMRSGNASILCCSPNTKNCSRESKCRRSVETRLCAKVPVLLPVCKSACVTACVQKCLCNCLHAKSACVTACMQKVPV